MTDMISFGVASAGLPLLYRRVCFPTSEALPTPRSIKLEAAALQFTLSHPSSHFTMASSRLLAPRLSNPARLRPVPVSLRSQLRTKATVPFRLPDPRNEPNVCKE